jgi:hypothetical protein
MKKLRATRKADRNYFDSQIAAFQNWLATIDSASHAAAAREHGTQTHRGQESPG